MILRGLFWDFLGKFFSQGISFIASIFLARILLPEDFGLVAIAIVFINISQVFIDAGFGAALIQKKEVSEQLYSSVFWLNVTSGLILTILFVFISHWVSAIYDKPELREVLQYFSLAFVINSLGLIQRIQLVKKMDFKRLSLIAAVSTFLSGVIAIYLAYQTKSYWALVVQQLCLFSFNTILLWFLNYWKPMFFFRFSILKSVWGFSSRKFVDGILTNIINSVDTLIIGKLFHIDSLGYYNRAKNLNEIIRSYSSIGLVNVLFPLFSRIQNKRDLCIRIYLKTLNTVSIISIGLALVLFQSSDEIITLLYTEKWSGSILFFKILVLSSFFFPINGIIVSFIQGLGFIKISFNSGLLKKLLRIIGFGVAMFFSIEYFALFISINVLSSFLINLFALNKKVDINLYKQLSPIIINLAIGLICYFVIAIIDFSYLLTNLPIILILKITAILTSYIILQLLFNRDSFLEIKGLIKRLKRLR